MKDSLGLVGVGAFGAFILPHLTPHFDVVLCDPHKDLALLANTHKAKTGDLKQAAACNIVVLAVPLQQMEGVLHELAPMVRPGTLVVDITSVKVKPVDMMTRLLPSQVDIVATHPLFGPQSGKNGIAGLNMVVCNIRGTRAASVVGFLKNELQLNVFESTAEEHDREMAYVQGLTHLLAKVIVSLDLPDFRFKTKTFEHLEKMVNMVRHDSDDLFHAIERENPFVGEAKKAFFAAADNLEKNLDRDK